MSNIRPLKKIKIDLDIQNVLPIASEFYFPMSMDFRKTYLCGHSLGLQPIRAEEYIRTQLLNWQQLAVEGHFEGETPWINYLDEMEVAMAKIVGARKEEVVIMNSLTANIHFLLAGFYKPTLVKSKIVMESPAFPSDIYALQSHIQVRGGQRDDLVLWPLNQDTGFFELGDLDLLLKNHSKKLSIIFVSGVNYLSGQYLDIKEITRLAHRYGLLAGFDLAHAAGNVELELHDWGVDFACWCTYKYLNGGPGSLGACFIHENHNALQSHFQGWWGNSMSNRFEMLPTFTPAEGAAGWQVSNPPLLALPSLKASLDLYDRYGMQFIRQKSVLLTSYLREIISQIESNDFTILTPSDTERHGAMLSLRFDKNGAKIFNFLSKANIVVDYRRPNIIRVAPHPLYNSYDDCYQFVKALQKAVEV